ncbi:MAG: AI-2E family transporter, partial [Thermoguttaceae bacterium]|nr:AI-2E family transporter [Thermoguttaceae bacterium]
MNGEHKIKRKPERQGLLKDYSVILGAMVVILAGIHSARGVLGPLFLATFFAALLNTPVNWLKDRGFKQWLALTIVIIGVAVVGLSSMTIIGTQIAQFARNIPEYRDRFNETLEGYNLDAGEIFPFLKSDDEKEKEKPAEEEEAKEAYLNELRWRDEYERSKNADADVAKKSKSDSEQKSQDKGEAPRGNLSESERAGLNAATIMPVSLTTDELFPDMETAIPASDLPQNEAAQPQQRPVPRDPLPTAAAQELAPDGSEGLIPGDPPAFRSHDDEVVKDVENALAETFNVDAANGSGAAEKSADEEEALPEGF